MQKQVRSEFESSKLAKVDLHGAGDNALGSRSASSVEHCNESSSCGDQTIQVLIRHFLLRRAWKDTQDSHIDTIVEESGSLTDARQSHALLI